MPPKAKAKKTDVYKMAELVAEGTVVVDLLKKEWKVGPVIGKGGFGRIYLTQPASSSATPADAAYVMKMEPAENGPLFCEIACFMRALTQKNVTEYLKRNRLSSIGLPAYHTQGMHFHHGDKYRFLVMQRMGQDLEGMLAASPNHSFAPSLVFHVASQVLQALKFLHTQGYAHADIKAANLMTGWKDTEQIYLIDFGLASRFMSSGRHEEYKEDKKRAHNGTCLYTSLDAHKGACPSARGDLEILGYCLWQWLEGRLPWQEKENDPVSVAAMKESYMQDIANKVAPCISDPASSKALCKYMEAVRALEYDQFPDYAALISLTTSFLKPPKNAFTSLTKTYIKSPKNGPIKSPKNFPLKSPPPALKSLPPALKSPPPVRKVTKATTVPLPSTATSAKKVIPPKVRVGAKASSTPQEVQADSADVAAAAAGGKRKAASRMNNFVKSPPAKKISLSKSPQTRGTDRRSPRKAAVAAVATADMPKNVPRKVRRVKVSQTSQAVQTSPGLLGLLKH